MRHSKLTKCCFHNAVTEVTFSADSIRTGDTETRHSNTVGCSLTKTWEHSVAYTTAVYNVLLIQRIVYVERRVVDEEAVDRTVNTAIQLQISKC